MPPQDVVQQLSVDLSVRHQLLDPRQIFVSPNAGCDRYDVFRTENFCGHTFVFDWLCIAHRFFGQSGCSKELDWEIFDEQLLALDPPTSGLQMRIDRVEFLRLASCPS